MTRNRRFTVTLFLVIIGGCVSSHHLSTGTAPPPRKPRVVVTTDPELDDSNSFVRYLVLEATDNGTPALTRYQRVLVTVVAP